VGQPSVVSDVGDFHGNKKGHDRESSDGIPVAPFFFVKNYLSGWRDKTRFLVLLYNDFNR
jgi:hypothetical protein